MSITDLDGVYGGALHSGIKADKLDLAYLYIPEARGSAGVFTQNKFVAPSVVYTKKILKHNVLKALVVNSGNANAATGSLGAVHVKKTAQIAANKLQLRPSEVAIASTGVIGRVLPFDKLESGLDSLLSAPLQKDGSSVAEAILTTDLVTKEVSVERKIGKKRIRISGITKGSGMIAPNMATTLSFLTTNANIGSSVLQECLSEAVSDSFNMSSVDNDTSTNDMVLIWSTGDYKISLSDRDQLSEFKALLTEACVALAKLIIRDGEGASKLFEVHVRGASNRQDARQIALQIINSPLVKTAIHGADPNWGRVLAAACKDPAVKINPDKIDLSFGSTLLFSKGKIVDYNMDDVVRVLRENDIQIHLDLHLAQGSAVAWGCDLTKGYIDINTQYC